jgi:uncharacterized membrane protein
MLKVISDFAVIAAAIVGVAVPVYILVRSILDYRRHEKRHRDIVVKALVSLLSWFLISLGMLFLLFANNLLVGFLMEPAAAEKARRSAMMSNIMFSVIYALIGCGLALWVRHKSDNEPMSILPEGAT